MSAKWLTLPVATTVIDARESLITTRSPFKPNHNNRPRRRICGRKEIEAALKAALAKDEPESVPQIARRLGMLALQQGYKDKKVLTQYFAGLCAELLGRRRALAKRRIARLQREIQSGTRLEPAQSMAEACRKLGLKPLTVSRQFPAEYKLIVRQYQ